MQIIHSDRPLIYLYHPVNRFGVAKNVAGVADLRRRPDPRRSTPGSSKRSVSDDDGRLPAAQGRSRPRSSSSLASMLVFLGVRALPGRPGDSRSARENRDPAVLAAIRHKYGLDQPLPVQYVQLARARAAAATSASTSASCRSRTRSSTRLPITLELAFLAIAGRRSLIGIPAGMIAAVRRGKAADYVATTGALVGLSRAALLARPDADHLLRGRPALAAGGGYVPFREDPVENLRAHADAGDRARHRLRRGADAADALVDARRRSAPTTSGPRARRACRERLGRRAARAAQQPDHGDDDHRPAARRADLRRGRSPSRSSASPASAG